MIPLPENLYLKMRAYRNKYIPLPEEYIRWHEKLAKDALRSIKFDWPIDYFFNSDGWNDGLDTIHASVSYHGFSFGIKWVDTKQQFIVYNSSQLNGQELMSVIEQIEAEE